MRLGGGERVGGGWGVRGGGDHMLLIGTCAVLKSPGEYSAGFR